MNQIFMLTNMTPQNYGDSHIFADNYPDKIRNLQPETYDEIKRIVDNELTAFLANNKRKPAILDIGAAGILPYDSELAEKVTILDLFPKPQSVILKCNVEWAIGNILSDTGLPLLKGSYDIIIMSSLLHHLCDYKNNIINNIRTCFRNSGMLLRDPGAIYIFESTCHSVVAKLQDILYPIYNFISVRMLNFTYIRQLSLKEIIKSLEANDFEVRLMPFKQPQYIALFFKRIPLKFSLLRLSALSASLKTE